MLRIDKRELAGGPVATEGELATDDPALAGLALALEGPVQVRGTLQASGHDDYLWRGRVSGRVAGECRRCLAPVHSAVEADVDVLS